MTLVFLIIYNILFIAGLAIGVPFLLLFKPGHLRHASERLGMLPRRKDCIWVHAASVGEIKASVPLLKSLAASGHQVHVTTVTPAGRKFASKLVLEGLSISYAPIDSIVFTVNAVYRLKPKALLILETELWPDMILAASLFHTRIVSINARLTERAFKGYSYIRPVMVFLLGLFRLICVQTAEDRERFVHLGAKPGTTFIAGNIKYAVACGKPGEAVRRLQDLFRGRRIVIAGSTHSGEEHIVCDCFASLKKRFAPIVLILAPRHLTRIAEVEEILRRSGLRYVKRSAMDHDGSADTADVVLLDTMGELSDLYRIGDAIFIGGSMVPVGGHNLIEAAIFKKPVIYGQYTGSIKELVSLFEGNGGLMVRNGRELYSAMEDLLEHPAQAEILGKKAYDIVMTQGGTLDSVMEIMKKEEIF